MGERRLAVLVGSSLFHYDKADLPNLKCPPNDVTGFAEVLSDVRRGGFDRIEKLIDSPWYEVLPRINEVLQEANYEDLVLIYYSGHGKLNSRGKLHLATPDTTISNLEATSIPIETIRGYIDGTKAERVILILDCCYSGRVADAFLRKGSINDDLKVTFEGGKGIYILTASTGIQTAQEKEGDEYSAFTKPLIQGIETGEADCGLDGQISMEDVYSYVKKDVAKTSPQTPMKWNLSGQGDIIISRSVKGRRTEFAAHVLLQERPKSLKDFSLPRTGKYFPSPSAWVEEVLYRIIIDRFSDGQETARPLLDKENLVAARPEPWSWNKWAESGAYRWQGGTLAGVKSKLDYLQKLGVTTIWLNPVFKQRAHQNHYEGYGVQDFLDVDPRIGSRQDLVDLVAASHDRGIRVILEIVVTHSGCNWVYSGGVVEPEYKPVSDHYPFVSWLGKDGREIKEICGPDDAVWPVELQNIDSYTRAGRGNLGAGYDGGDPNAEGKRCDFHGLRRFNLQQALSNLVRCYNYWIALTDCDGFCIDSLRNASFEEGRNICSAIKEFANCLGKNNFLLAGEVDGGDYSQDRFLDVLGRNLNAALDTGAMQLDLISVAKGLSSVTTYFDGFDSGNAELGSHRGIANLHISILDDPKHVLGDKVRFSGEADSDHQVVAGVALQLFTLGIPCIYYGTEQALSGPRPAERKLLPLYRDNVYLLHEAMFGPNHPRKEGCASLLASPLGVDSELPGFGPLGTAGYHCFDESSPTFMKIAALIETRRNFGALRYGRQYLRPIAVSDGRFQIPNQGELIAWARLFGEEEVVCIINPHGFESRSAKVIVDSKLNHLGGSMKVILNTEQVDSPDLADHRVSHPLASEVMVKCDSDGNAFVEIQDIQPSAVICLSNLS